MSKSYASRTTPATGLESVTAGVAYTKGLSRGLLVGTAGLATVVMAEGTSIASVPLQAGINL